MEQGSSQQCMLGGQEKKGRTSNKVFRLDIRRNLFPLKAAKQRSILHREFMPSPSLEVFRTWLDKPWPTWSDLMGKRAFSSSFQPELSHNPMIQNVTLGYFKCERTKTHTQILSLLKIWLCCPLVWADIVPWVLSLCPPGERCRHSQRTPEFRESMGTFKFLLKMEKGKLRQTKAVCLPFCLLALTTV